jgi:hypothetical protein
MPGSLGRHSGHKSGARGENVKLLVKTLLPALAIAVGAGPLTGCSGRSVPSSMPPTSAAEQTARPTPAVAPSPSTMASLPPAAGQVAGACTPEVFLPLMKRKFDDPSKGLIIERVQIERCRNGYAQVFAITRRNPPDDPNQYENEQVFLRLVNGQWQSVAEGTGISCSDDELRPELVAPCRSLGYRG